jgi:undecaprenyl-diphosphatase
VSPEDLQGHPGWVVAWKTITTFGSTPFLFTLVLVVAGLLAYKTRRQDAQFLLFATFSGWLLNNTIKLLVNRPRPDPTAALVEARGSSFPSGHTMTSLVVFGALWLIATRGGSRASRFVSGFLVLVLAVLIGLSRVALGAHHPEDVVGAICFGAAWLFLVARFWRSRREDVPVGEANADRLGTSKRSVPE